jgi:heptosyltransferase I
MPDNILIIKPSALGDVACALPVLTCLRANYPHARITWLVRGEFEPLLKIVSGLDDTVIFDRKRLNNWWCNPKIFAELMQFLAKLRNAEYDLVIDLQCLFRTAFFTWITNSKQRVGLNSGRELSSFFYNIKVHEQTAPAHVIDRYLNVLSQIGCDTTVTKPVLNIPDNVRSSLAETFRKNNIPDSSYAVFVPTAAHEYKCWPIENFAEIASWLASEYSLPVIAVGTAGDKEYIDRMLAPSLPIYNLAGQTNIPELVQLLRGAKFTLSNDTGPGQIASVLKVPMVMIVGNTNPEIFGPYAGIEYAAAVEPDNRPPVIKDFRPEFSVKKVTVSMVKSIITAKFCENL